MINDAILIISAAVSTWSRRNLYCWQCLKTRSISFRSIAVRVTVRAKSAFARSKSGSCTKATTGCSPLKTSVSYLRSIRSMCAAVYSHRRLLQRRRISEDGAQPIGRPHDCGVLKKCSRASGGLPWWPRRAPADSDQISALVEGGAGQAAGFWDDEYSVLTGGARLESSAQRLFEQTICWSKYSGPVCSRSSSCAAAMPVVILC